jgi:DNA invertase Pin-like site-specific DNA recombinase
VAVIIYTRVSTREQDKRGSGLEAQEQVCRAWAEREGLEVKAVYQDRGVSGSVPACERAGFMNALDDLQPGDVLLLHARSRLGRGSMVDNAVAERLVHKAGAEIKTLDVPTEAEEAERMLFSTLLDAFATYERALTRKRTRQALAVKRAKGLQVGSAPLGMKADDEGRLIPDEAEQAAVARVRELRTSGLSFEQVAKQAAAEGIKTRRGNPPSKATCAEWCRGMPKPAVLKAQPRKPRTGKARGGRPPRQVVGLAETCKDLRDKGMTYTAIAAEVSKRGFTTSKGKPLQATQVARILARGQTSEQTEQG